MDGILSCECLPATNSDVDKTGFNFKGKCAAPDALGGKDGRTRPGKRIEHDIAALRAVFDGVGNKCDWLDCRMRLEVFHAPGAEGIDTGVSPNIRPIAAVAT